MRLMHPVLDEPIFFREGQVQVLAVENPAVFRRIAGDLIAQSEGDAGEAVLSLRYKVLDCASNMQVVWDYFHPESMDRKITAGFLAYAQRVIQEELLQEKDILMDAMNRFLSQVVQSLDIPADFEAGDKLTALLKASGFGISLEGMSSMEALIEHLGVYSALMKDQCFVLVDAKAYFTSEELKQLYLTAVYKKWNLLLLEPRAGERIPEFENTVVIDADLCLLHLQ